MVNFEQHISEMTYIFDVLRFRTKIWYQSHMCGFSV